MAFRFRRSVKLMPGVRLNVGKTGLSVTAGGRGARVTVGRKGTTVSGGIPGTGLGFQHRVGQGQRQSSPPRESATVQVSLRVEEDGSVGAYSGSERLPPRFVTAAFKQDAVGIRRWLENEAQERDGLLLQLGSVHCRTPPPTYRPRFREAPFPEERPVLKRLPNFTVERPPEPTEPKVTGLVRVIPGLAAKRMARFERACVEHQAAVSEWREKGAEHDRQVEAKKAEYEGQLAEWRRRKVEHQAAERATVRESEEALARDTEFMAQVLMSRFKELEWPLETFVNFDVLSAGRVVCLDVDLPEIEDLPQTKAVLSKTGKRLLIKKLPASEGRKLYARHIHGIVLRLLGEVFAALPKVEEAVVSGYSQRLDPSTGRESDEYLLSVRASRESLARIDFSALSKVDPVEALATFDCRRKMTKTGVFRPIEPFEYRTE